MRLYSLYDKKVGEFQNVIQSRTDEAVMRALSELLSGDNQVSKYPGDFQLYFLGTMNMESGLLEGVSPSQLVCDVSSLTYPEEKDAERADA